MQRRAPKRAVLQLLIERFAAAGVAGLYILGTTGEGTLLSERDRQAFAETVLEISDGTLPVIVHTGHDRTEVACKLSRHAKTIGAAAVAVAPPCRYRFEEGELRVHYLEIAAAIGALPLFLYDIPSTTGNPLGGALLDSLHAEAPNILGAKVSRSDWEAWEGYLALTDELVLFIGKDEMALPLLSLGGDGLVSSGANVFPEFYVSLYRAAKQGDREAGKKLQKVIIELCRVTHRGSVSTIKRALTLMGWEVGPPFPPLRSIQVSEDAAINAQLASLKKRAAQWLTKGGGSETQ